MNKYTKRKKPGVGKRKKEKGTQAIISCKFLSMGGIRNPAGTQSNTYEGAVSNDGAFSIGATAGTQAVAEGR